MQSIKKYNEKIGSDSYIKDAEFNKLIKEISSKTVWLDDEKESLKVFVNSIKINVKEKMKMQDLSARNFLRKLHSILLNKDKLGFNKNDIEDILHETPSGVSEELFEKLLNKDVLYGEKGIYWLRKILGKKYISGNQGSLIKVSSLVSFYEKTKWDQKEPKWSYLYELLKRGKQDFHNGFEKYISLIKKEEQSVRGDILEENSDGENIVTTALVGDNNNVFFGAKGLMDLKRYISEGYGVENFKKLFNAPINQKGGLIGAINKNGLLKEEEYIDLINNISDENIKNMSNDDFIKIISRNILKFNDINSMLLKRKEKNDNVLGVLLNKYKKEIPKELIKELYKKEIELKDINFNFNFEEINLKNYTNLVELVIKHKLINNNFYKEENESLIKNVSELPPGKASVELFKKVLDFKKYKKDQIISILNVIGDKKKEKSYQSNILNLIINQDVKIQDELVSEYLKDNLNNESLNSRLLVMQKYKQVNMERENQEIIIKKQLENNSDIAILISMIFETEYGQEKAKEFFENIKINKDIAENVINKYLESNNVSVNGLVSIILNHKNIQNLELNETIKKNIKQKLNDIVINKNIFNQTETDIKKVQYKIKLMCQYLYLDDYYVTKTQKKEIVNYVVNAKDWVVLEQSWVYQKELNSEILKDLVVYHINNNKEFLKDFLKIENKMLKGLIAERIINEAIDNRYKFNKIGKEIIKESIEFLSQEAKPRKQDEEILFNHIANYDKKNIKKEKTIELRLEYLEMNKKCYLDILSLNENKTLEQVIKGKELLFVTEINQEALAEYMNEEKFSEKSIEKMMNDLSKGSVNFEGFYLRLKNKYKNNIAIVNNLLLTPIKGYESWNYIGDEIKEKLNLTKENIEEKLSKYDSVNTEGIFGYLARRRKDNLQEEINKECDIKEKENWNIKKWLKQSNNLHNYLNENELANLMKLEKEIKQINELGKENMSSYNTQEIKKDCEYILKIIGTENFIKKIEEINVKIIKIKEEIKENIKMELKKEVAVINYRM